MKSLLAGILLLLSANTFAGSAAAQVQNTGTGDNLRVYLLTFGPGDAVWERFGHNAIAISDANTGINVAYNWGMFSFDQPGFVPRLMKGMMLYWMAGYDTNAFIESYIQANRSVYLQELNLTTEQRVAMRDFVEWNAREENKYYTYDYYRDNCSTRVRDAIDRVVNGAVKRALEAQPANSTYRSRTQALTYTDPVVYTGLMLAMGPRIDQPLNAWQDAFIPMQLRESIRGVKVPGPNGTMIPLVAVERTLFAASRSEMAAKAPSRVVPFTIVGCLIAALLLALYRYGHARRPLAIVLASAIAIVSLLVGFFGTLISLLWAFTNHVVTYNNENLLQANALSLLLVYLAPAALLGIRARRWAVWIALFVSGCSTLGFLLQALPQFDQVNGDVIGLLMPVHAAIALILWQRWHVELSHVEAAAPPAKR